MRKHIDIEAVLQHYDITEDGLLWSKIKGRWLKPQVNIGGYVFYFISRGMEIPSWMFAHTLVALRYIGYPASMKLEINHKDGNRMNNHYRNLEWVTHSENQLKAYREQGRTTNKGKHYPPVALETRMKMANAKKKRVLYENGDDRRVFESIEDASSGLGTYRKRIYLCIKDSLPIGGGYLKFISEA